MKAPRDDHRTAALALAGLCRIQRARCRVAESELAMVFVPVLAEAVVVSLCIAIVAVVARIFCGS